MEAILALRDKYQTTNASQLKGLLLKEIEQINHLKNEQDQHLNDDLERVEELTRLSDTLKENLQHETQTLEVKQQELSKHLALVQELQNEKTKFLKEKKVLEIKKNTLLGSKPSVHDQKVLETGKRKINYYKNFTRIRWDYAELEKNIAGYVSNKSDYINHFSYENPNNDTLADKLWKEIEQSVTGTYNTIECDNKENIANN